MNKKEGGGGDKGFDFWNRSNPSNIDILGVLFPYIPQFSFVDILELHFSPYLTNTKYKFGSGKLIWSIRLTALAMCVMSALNIL